MAAPQIPNLSTLRGGRGRGRGRVDGFAAGPPTPQATAGRAASDRIVQRTDQDASISRLSAVELGYLEDPYARSFVQGDSQRRFPIINRGTYVRTRSIDDLVDRFIASSPNRKIQIISLGAGSDTRYFRLVQRQSDEESRLRFRSNVVYHELDFETNVNQKISVIGRNPLLRETLGSPLQNGLNGIVTSSDNYHLHSVDLRLLGISESTPRLEYVDNSLPTLIISECCLVYLDPDAADRVVKYFVALILPSIPVGIVVYEPIKPNDAFGKVMVSNLATRGIVLQTLRKYGSLEAQAARMKFYGFDASRGDDINGLWQRGVSGEEKERVARLEMMDEVEEWELLAGHYCVVWAWREGEPGGFWNDWKTAFSEATA